MQEIFENAIQKAEYLRCAASLGHICDTRGEHVTDGSATADDAWYREIGYAFCKLLSFNDFASFLSKDLEKLLIAIDKPRMEQSRKLTPEYKDEENYEDTNI